MVMVVTRAQTQSSHSNLLLSLTSSLVICVVSQRGLPCLIQSAEPNGFRFRVACVGLQENLPSGFALARDPGKFASIIELEGSFAENPKWLRRKVLVHGTVSTFGRSALIFLRRRKREDMARGATVMQERPQGSGQD